MAPTISYEYTQYTGEKFVISKRIIHVTDRGIQLESLKQFTLSPVGPVEGTFNI